MTFQSQRRQDFLDEESFRNTLLHLKDAELSYREQMGEERKAPGEFAAALRFMAADRWAAFQLRYTAGESLTELAQSLTDVVEAFEDYVDENEGKPDRDYAAPFRMHDMVDTYIDYLHLICVSILLHREDLIPRIHGLVEGTDYDGVDAVIEDLLQFFLPDRPEPDEWFWNMPYRTLLDAIDAETSAEQSQLMKKYVEGWYSALKGKAAFWGQHEKIKPDFSPYFGYWAMCAAAFSYLYNIDDSSYRDNIVYPKDLVDFARSLPRGPVRVDGREMLRVVGGQPCPREGIWFTPAKADSSRRFRVGEIMPVFESTDYGMTIWQLNA